jgi:hypothetical protein
MKALLQRLISPKTNRKLVRPPTAIRIPVTFREHDGDELCITIQNFYPKMFIYSFIYHIICLSIYLLIDLFINLLIYSFFY